MYNFRARTECPFHVALERFFFRVFVYFCISVSLRACVGVWSFYTSVCVFWWIFAVLCVYGCIYKWIGRTAVLHGNKIEKGREKKQSTKQTITKL